jgi:hypothetical protein
MQNKMRNAANLDATLSFTQSSFAYKDPYQPRGSLPYKAGNKMKSFFAMRSIENEFADFKVYNLDRQFREILSDLSIAYKRNDKVVMQRSQSQAMFKFTVELNKAKKPSPFLREIHTMTNMQARVYHENDHLLPEDQWAQFTMRLKGTKTDGTTLTQYSVFERRMADKLSYLDWKLSMLADEEDFILMHSNDVK